MQLTDAAAKPVSPTTVEGVSRLNAGYAEERPVSQDSLSGFTYDLEEGLSALSLHLEGLEAQLAAVLAYPVPEDKLTPEGGVCELPRGVARISAAVERVTRLNERLGDIRSRIRLD